MIIRVCYFTKQGQQTAESLMEGWEDMTPDYRTDQSLFEWTRDCFEKRLPILFVGACGIAVRAIAPFVADKLEDSAVLVMDEQGEFIIPILSGHVGGANDLAYLLADRIGATAVITTATDVESLFAIDVFARKNGLAIKNREGIRLVSGKILGHQKITIAVEDGIAYAKEELPEVIELVPYPPEEPVDVLISGNLSSFSKEDYVLGLVPKPYVLGIGCKKGKTFEEIKAFIEEEIGVRKVEEEFFGFATIDLKKDERGLVMVSQYLTQPFLTYTAEELGAVEGDFTESEFVEQITGVASVCERAAMCAAGPEAELITRKTARDGMTLAVAKRKIRIHF